MLLMININPLNASVALIKKPVNPFAKIATY